MYAFFTSFEYCGVLDRRFTNQQYSKHIYLPLHRFFFRMKVYFWQVMLAQSGGSEMQLAQAHNAKARAEERWQQDADVTESADSAHSYYSVCRGMQIGAPPAVPFLTLSFKKCFIHFL